jgi:hypothetical protein
MSTFGAIGDFVLCAAEREAPKTYRATIVHMKDVIMGCGPVIVFITGIRPTDTVYIDSRNTPPALEASAVETRN